MLNLPNSRPEARYGMPAADQILFNRDYIIGYSYYFRQAKWALEIVDPKKKSADPNEAPVGRSGNFRPDYRVPKMFRAELVDYENSGYDRGHLVASANKQEEKILNSETFLLSNMSPQDPKLNQGIWKKLEGAVRELVAKPKIYEAYVLCGPIFDFNTAVSTFGLKNKSVVTLPIPHSYFKSILTENKGGKFDMWSFIIPNKTTNKSLKDCLVPTTDVENFSGLMIWERLLGDKIEGKKGRKQKKMW